MKNKPSKRLLLILAAIAVVFTIIGALIYLLYGASVTGGEMLAYVIAVGALLATIYFSLLSAHQANQSNTLTQRSVIVAEQANKINQDMLEAERHARIWERVPLVTLEQFWVAPNGDKISVNVNEEDLEKIAFEYTPQYISNDYNRHGFAQLGFRLKSLVDFPFVLNFCDLESDSVQSKKTEYDVFRSGACQFKGTVQIEPYETFLLLFVTEKPNCELVKQTSFELTLCSKNTKSEYYQQKIKLFALTWALPPTSDAVRAMVLYEDAGGSCYYADTSEGEYVLLKPYS